MGSPEEQPLPPSANVAPVPTTHVQAIEDATTPGAKDEAKSPTVAEKKKAEAGLKNYFVRPSAKGFLRDTNARPASVLIRNRIRCASHSAQLSHLNRCRYRIPTDGMLALL